MAVKSLRESRWRVFVLLGALAVGLAAVSESPRARVWATEVNVETKPVSQGGSETSPSRVEAKQEVSVWPMPLPSLEARQKARKLLEEVYKDQIAKARLPHEKGKLAKEMLDLALDDLDPANQYVLAEEARRLALEAMDRKLVMRAVELLAQFEPVVGKVSAQEAAKRGHTAWAASERWTGKAQLERLAEAAEWYLHALRGNLAEMEKGVIQKRLAELGLKSEPYLAPQEVVQLFGIPNAKITGEMITWPDHGKWLMTSLKEQQVEFGFEILAAQNHIIRAYIGDRGYAIVRGAGGKQETWRHTDFHGPYRPVLLAPLGVDLQWHRMRLVLDDRRLKVYYDDELLDEIDRPINPKNADTIKVGFGDHRTLVSIRRVYIKRLGANQTPSATTPR